MTPDDALSLKEFGALIRQLRSQQGLSAADFGQRAGLPTETVEALEAGTREFELAELFAVGRGLGMDLSAIFRVAEASAGTPSP